MIQNSKFISDIPLKNLKHEKINSHKGDNEDLEINEEINNNMEKKNQSTKL